MFRSWAFWRRVQYTSGVIAFLLIVFTGVYFGFFYTPANCFDGMQNGAERGVDCGGACERVCAFDVTEPIVRWSQSFRVTNGFYNAVAYIENRNPAVGTKDLRYTFTLYDSRGGVITTRNGTTRLPPDSIYPIFEGRIAVGTREPVRTFIEFAPVEDWRPMDDEREKFVIDSRELTNADSQPRLDVAISNTLLTDERDVELVATIFDARGNALTASRTVVPLFEARAAKNVVFTWPEPIAKTLRSCEVPSDVMVAIDLSGSINDDGGTPPEPISSVLEAARLFVSRLRTGDQAGVVTFATAAELVRNLSADRSGTAALIDTLAVDPKEERGSTNIGDPIILATEEFASSRHSTDARKVLVLLTDGKANAPTTESAEMYAQEAAIAAKADDVIVFTIGLGSNVNQEFLTSLASSPEHKYFAPDADALDDIYRSISSAICEDGAAVIDIVPKVTSELGDGV